MFRNKVRILGLLAVLLFVFDAMPVAAQPLPQLIPGPFRVATWDWNFGTTTTTHPITGAPLNVNHFGRIYYPADPNSTLPQPPVAPGGPFPLTVFGHGRFHAAPWIGVNHLGASYLMEHLASWGIVANSVNLDVVGQFGFPAAISQRGDILLSTTGRTLNLAAQPVTPPPGLATAINGNLIALMGHSRGGDGAVDAAIKNLASGTPFNIQAVATMAPTDFNLATLTTLPYMSLYGSHDGDVNNGWPIRLHDNATSNEKVFEFIHGANHFYFTDAISFFLDGIQLSRLQQHSIAKGYLGGFIFRKLLPTPLTSSVFADGPQMSLLTSQFTILPMYRDPVRFPIDDFETNFATTLTSIGTPASAAATAFGELPLTTTIPFLFHSTRGLGMFWQAPTGAVWIAALPGQGTGGFNASGFPQLSMKFAQRPLLPNPPNMSQDAFVAVLDEDGDLAVVQLSTYGDIPYPSSFPPIKSVLRTTRIPLADFPLANPAVDLTRLSFVAWANVNPNGELTFDDIEFTQ